MLDARLSLVYDLYPACSLAADIGTDHGYLPCALLETGKVNSMILTDISSSALSHAAFETERRGLSNRVTLLTGDGLMPVDRTCEAVSITGMGGRTIRQILLNGQQKLNGATLILSAHTDLPLLRKSLIEIGYTVIAEEICKAASRFYLVFKAVPGKSEMTEREIRLGSLLFSSVSPCLPDYLLHRRHVLERKLKGLLTTTDIAFDEQINTVREDIDFLDRHIRV